MRWLVFFLLLAPSPIYAADWSASIAKAQAVIRVVSVNVNQDQGGAVGSAVCVGPRHAITVSHIFLPTHERSMVVAGDAHASIAKMDVTLDLALLVVQRPTCSTWVIPNTEPYVGQELMAVGFAYGGTGLKYAWGRVASEIDTDLQMRRTWLDDGSLYPAPGLWADVRSAVGMSGGAFLDIEGRLLGIHQGSVGPDGFRTASPASVLQDFIGRLWSN